MDLPLALVSLGSFPILFVMTRVFRSHAERAYRAILSEDAETIAEGVSAR
jgi:hypothetical protein